MKKIGIISDTHSYWDDKYLHYFEPCDEIWHAGDIGSVEVAERLAAFRPLRAVCGNCDGGDLRLMYPEKLRWRCEERRTNPVPPGCRDGTRSVRWCG